MQVTSAAVHAYPECKDIWRRLDAAGRQQLLSLGSILWDAREVDMGEKAPPELLHELERNGVFVFEEDE